MADSTLAPRLAALLELPSQAMAAALARQAALGGSLDTCLLEGGQVEEPALLAALAACHRLPAAGRQDIDAIGAHLPHLFPRTFAEAHGVVPAGLHEQVLGVLCHGAPPPDLAATIRARLSLTLAPQTTTELRLHDAMRRLYGVPLPPRLAALMARLDGPASRPAVVATAHAAGPDLRTLLARIDAADDRDAILAVVMDFAYATFAYAGLFVVRGDTIVGWRGQDEASTAQLRRVEVHTSVPSVFQTLYATCGHYLGPLPEGRANSELLAALGRAPPRTAFLAPLVVGGRLAAILYADHGQQRIGPTRVAVLLALLQRGSLALERLVRRRRAEAAATAAAGTLPAAAGGRALVPPAARRGAEAWGAGQGGGPVLRGAARDDGPGLRGAARDDGPVLRGAARDDGPVRRETHAGRAMALPGPTEARGPTWEISADGPQATGVPAAGASATARGLAAERATRWLDALDRAEPDAWRGILAQLLPLAAAADEAAGARFPGSLVFSPLDHPGRPPAFARCGGLAAWLAARGAAVTHLVLPQLAADRAEARYMATYYFVAWPRPEAAAALARRLYDVEPRIRQLAVEALRRVPGCPGYLEVVRSLLEQLALDAPSARVAAAQILGQLREPTAVPALVDQVDARVAQVAESASAALALICAHSFGRDRDRWLAWWRPAAALPRAAWLEAGLAHVHPGLRRVAAAELALLQATPAAAHASGGAGAWPTEADPRHATRAAG